MDHIDLLSSLADKKYKEFNSSLIPTLPKECFIGVRTPELRKIAKKTDASFLLVLPHTYFEENQLHAFMISDIKEFDLCIAETERFLPYVDNWATCDQMSPVSFCKNKKKLLDHISVWILSDHVYTVRFAVNMLMKHFLGQEFDVSYCEMVKNISLDNYYVKMVSAWYFATALYTNWDEVIIYLEEHRLDEWIHNKTIQKAIESHRITPQQKNYLRTLKK